MANRVTVDSDYLPVDETDPTAAFIFDADDVRLEKYRKRAEADMASGRRQPSAVVLAARDEKRAEERRAERRAQKAALADEVDEDDGTVVATSRKRS